MSEGARNPHLFDPPLDDDEEPMRVYEITAKDEQMVDRLCSALADVLTKDKEFLEWLDERDLETIEAIELEVM